MQAGDSAGGALAVVIINQVTTKLNGASGACSLAQRNSITKGRTARVSRVGKQICVTHRIREIAERRLSVPHSSNWAAQFSE